MKGKNIMPSYYDENTKTWFCKFYYQDYTGARKQKKKRGFKRQKDAKEWERDFLNKKTSSLSMTFKEFSSLYFSDMEKRLKQSTILCKENVVFNKLMPFLGNIPVDKITPQIVRNWQNEVLSYRDKTGNPYSPVYLRTMNKELKCILNYAVTYYNLNENPCKKAGSIGSSSNGKEMLFWTKEEFDKFVSCVEEPGLHEAFLVLYYTGMRVGEMLALTWGDIHLNDRTISITKTYHRFGSDDVITTPKTRRSVRKVPIPPFLCDILNQYKQRHYKPNEKDRAFHYTKVIMGRKLRAYCPTAGVKRIRVHDLRHSHVSLLINLDFKPILIAERIGDSVDMVNNVYGHLYPNEHSALVDKLEELNNSTNLVPKQKNKP